MEMMLSGEKKSTTEEKGKRKSSNKKKKKKKKKRRKERQQKKPKLILGSVKNLTLSSKALDTASVDDEEVAVTTESNCLIPVISSYFSISFFNRKWSR